MAPTPMQMRLFRMALAGLEQAYNDRQRDQGGCEGGEPSRSRTRAARQGIDDRQDAEDYDRVDKVEQLAGPSAAHEETEAACDRHDQHHQQQRLESTSPYAWW